MLASNCELRIAKAQVGVEDFGVRGLTETRVKFPDPLGDSWSVSGVFL